MRYNPQDSMSKKQIVKSTIYFVKKQLEGDPTGHDWWHISRVVTAAKKIAKGEKGVDLFIIEMAALLHDVGDYKTQEGGRDRQEELISKFLKKQNVPPTMIEAILEIILNMSFSKNVTGKKSLSREGQIVQDADRLDSLGAIGIARAFSYGGKKGRVMYDPSQKPKKYTSTRAYRTTNTHTINHFYEKLLHITGLMNTRTGKKMAQRRHKFLEKYLEEFYKEWNVRI